MMSLLPGPVEITQEVKTAFFSPLLSHREEAFLSVYVDLRQRIESMMNGTRVAVMMGSGTLANDAVAACLRASLGDKYGLVLANGEFGERIQQQAKRAGLIFETVSASWGDCWDLSLVEKKMQNGCAWVWGVHLETSTGRLNDLRGLSTMCLKYGVELIADCVSSLGAVSLQDISFFLASGVSGKAIGSYAGLSFVFASNKALRLIRRDLLPSTFDIRTAIESDIPMFTLASPQTLALHTALRLHYGSADASAERYMEYALRGEWLRKELMQWKLQPIVVDEGAAPTIATFDLPDGAAERSRQAGFLIAHQSGYLQQRNWGQIGVMGDVHVSKMSGLFPAIVGA